MKLSAGIWILWGFCIFICCIIGGWVVYQPNEGEAKARRANKEVADGESDKKPRAQKRLKDAVALVEKEVGVWQGIVAQKTPPTSVPAGGIDISENGAQLVVDSGHYRNSLQAAVNHQVKVGGIKLLSQGPIVTDPGESPSTILAQYYNYPAIPFPVVIFDFGTVSVEGTYEQIMANVRGWKNMPNYLAVADGLRLEGTSPHLQGTYSLSLVGYIRTKTLFPTLPEIPGSASTGAGGGFAPGAPAGAGSPASPAGAGGMTNAGRIGGGAPAGAGGR